MAVVVGLSALGIGQFAVTPVMQAWSFGSGTDRQAPPVGLLLRLGDRLGVPATSCCLPQDANQ